MKKNISTISLTTIAIVMMFISITNVTSRGVYEGFSTMYQTIILSVDFLKQSNSFFNYVFFVAILLFIVSDFIIYKYSKTRGTLLICLNIFIITISFLLFLNCNYIIMLFAVQVSIFFQIILQCFDNNRKCFNAIVSTLTGSILAANIFFLIKHLSIATYFSQSGVNMTENRMTELVDISQINMICFGAFLIPCAVIIINQLLSKRNQSKTL